MSSNQRGGGTATVDGEQAISVFVLDDHEMVRRGLRQVIDAQPDMEVVGEAASHRGSVDAIVRTHPDVAVLDISLGDGSGLDVCRKVTEQADGVACLMLTSVVDDRALIAASDAGAAGFCLKAADGQNLLTSIRRVADGARLLDQAEVGVARRRLATRGDGRVDTLTAQERRIFDLVGRGCSNRQIGEDLFLAEKTVKNYVSNVLSKLGLSRRTEIAAMAARLAEREGQWRP
mgnify:CR=1 FL=1